jgi:ABC-2 type transport system permease protein
MKYELRRRRRDSFILIGLILVIILLNYTGSFVFHRFDLTSEKRYTLSPASKEMAKNLDGIAFFKVYLDGKLPAGFIKLRDETKEMLDEFRAYSGGKIQYEFIDPSANPNKEECEAIYKQLEKEGLNPTTLEVNDNSGSSEQTIFPGAILNYKDRETPIAILQSQAGQDPQTAINSSIEQLEYDIDNAIHKLSIDMKEQVAVITGHGGIDSIHLASAVRALKEYYIVKRVNINHRINALQGFKSIIIAKPDSGFDDKDAFIIDQFIMHGGTAMWLISPVYAPLDSLNANGYTLAFPADLGLEDQLYHYGVRLNNNLVLDLQCSAIPLNTAIQGEPAHFKLFPWYFKPLVTPETNNPIVRNLNLIELNLASTLDTIAVKGVKKTILLRSSRYTKLLNTPTRVSFKYTQITADESQFNKRSQSLAVLLEGIFHSPFEGRISIQLDTSKLIGFRAQSKRTAMIVVADGDIIRNEIRHSDNSVYPLGFDVYTGDQFGNKDFIVNSMNYLCGDSALLSIRGKQLKLRLLDTSKTTTEKVKWQVINMCVPIALILLFGMAWAWVRKEKYAK